MRPNELPRPLVVGPDSGPIAPFPLRVSGKVISGFGRGSKELGIPTANIPIEGLSVGGHEDVESGVYYGWAGLEDTAPAPAPAPAPSQEQEKGEEEGEEKTVPASTAQSTEKNNNHKPPYPALSKGTIYPMVMSIGWNPYYRNSKRSVEVHLLHFFPHDFYGARLNLLILGFIRPEYDYVSKEALVADIMTDIEVARGSLAREAYAKLRTEEEGAWLLDFGAGKG
ncbi:MAG: riboflavin kinase [Vezdaea acicularis]|nr:MAG: riboflavin kinase [Vezdaea acicularis]